MRNLRIILSILVLTALFAGVPVFAQSGDPAVAAGQTLWNQLQSKQIQCNGLSDVNFKDLGEYFMDQMMDGAHEAMDQAVLNNSGQSGLDQMHIAMGERFSGCNPSAAFSSGMMGYGMPMMGGGYDNNYYNSGASSTPYQNTPYFNMMNFGYGPMGGWGFGFGGIVTTLFWILVIVGVIALIRWMSRESKRSSSHEKSALEILKERYVKGEIDRKEFEEKKKDIEV